MASLIDILVRMRGARAAAAQANQLTGALERTTAAAKAAAVQTDAAIVGMSTKGATAFGRVGRQAKLLSVGLAVLGGYAYKSAADFQQSLNIFGAVAEGAGGQMKAARQEAIKLGADVRLPGVTAASAADTMLLLAKAGFTAAQAIHATKGALLLSQAASMDSVESTTVLSRTLKAFGMNTSKAGVVVDALAAGELKTTVTMREIADGLTYASASAHQMGLDVVDTTTALALLNDAGIAGSKAGTSLNQMFVRMASPTKKARDALQALGLWTERGTAAFFDQQGEFVGFRRASKLLTASLAGLTRQQKLQYLYAIFGREGQRAADRVLSRGAATWDKYRAAIGKTGQAQKLVDARMKGSRAAIESLKNSYQTFMVALGSALAPVLDRVLRALALFFNLLTRFPKPTAVLAAALFGLAAAIVALNVVVKLRRNFAMLNEELALATKATRALTVATETLDAAFLADPIVLAVVAAIALVAGLVILYYKWRWFHNAVNDTFKFIRRWWPLILLSLIGPFALLPIFVVRHFDLVKRIVLGVVNWIAAHWRLLAVLLGGPFGLLTVLIIDHFRSIERVAVSAFTVIRSVVDWLIRRVNVLLGVLAKVHFPHIPGSGYAGDALGIAGDVGRFAGVLPKKGAALGGVIRQSGALLVGERGPEVAYLPVGARVDPLTMSGHGRSGGGLADVVVPVQVVLDRRVVGEAVARWAADKQARR